MQRSLAGRVEELMIALRQGPDGPLVKINRIITD
jgi:hypothetical protein